MDPIVFIKELLGENNPMQLQTLGTALGKDDLVKEKIIDLLLLISLANPCLAHNIEHPEEFAGFGLTMLALGFESGRRAGRTQLMEEIGMPK